MSPPLNSKADDVLKQNKGDVEIKGWITRREPSPEAPKEQE
jgi:hypothetical protein